MRKDTGSIWNKKKWVQKNKKAGENWVMTSRNQILENNSRQYQEIVRIRYNEGQVVRKGPLELRISLQTRPTQAELRRYALEERRFHRKYLSRVQKLGLVKIAEHTEQMSAVPIVPKISVALYRMTIGYQPSNAASV